MQRVVKLKSKLPIGTENGLADLADQLAKDPTRQRVALVLFDVDRNVTRHSDEIEEVHVIVNRIEPVLDDEEAFVIKEKLGQLYANRTGEHTLPPDLMNGERRGSDLLQHGSGLHVGRRGNGQPEPDED